MFSVSFEFFVCHSEGVSTWFFWGSLTHDDDGRVER